MQVGPEGKRWNGPVATALLLAALALVLRWPDQDNPLLDLDDQMYALVGGRMWNDALPYVDIWDRKPVGLFLIYALADRIAAPPLGYALLATLAAVVTVWLIAMMGRRVAGPVAGLCAGAVYLVWLELLGGRAGQSPVFYNGLIAGVAWLVWRAVERPARTKRYGIPAMMLVGLALQLKPTVVFEGCCFGIALAWVAWRGGVRGRALAGAIGALIVAALLPTFLAFVGYAALGHADAWWFANVTSIFLRDVTPHDPVTGRLTGIALMLMVPFGAAISGLIQLPAGERWFAAGWLAAAVVGVLAVPPYYNHYALPLVVPVAVLAGIGMAASRPFALLVGASGAALLLWSGYPHGGDAADARRRLSAMAQVIDRYRGDDCLFAFSAPPVFYQATGSCLPTRWPFAPHLTLTSETRAIGTAQTAEVIRILATRPPVIVTGPPLSVDINHAAYAAVAETLRRDYVRVAGDLGYTIFARRDRQTVASR